MYYLAMFNGVCVDKIRKASIQEDLALRLASWVMYGYDVTVSEEDFPVSPVSNIRTSFFIKLVDAYDNTVSVGDESLDMNCEEEDFSDNTDILHEKAHQLLISLGLNDKDIISCHTYGDIERVREKIHGV